MVKYSQEPDNQTKSCKARGSDLRVHFKRSVAVYRSHVNFRDIELVIVIGYFILNGIESVPMCYCTKPEPSLSVIVKKDSVIRQLPLGVLGTSSHLSLLNYIIFAMEVPELDFGYRIGGREYLLHVCIVLKALTDFSLIPTMRKYTKT